MNTNNPRRAFWKEPMMWLVVGLPLASVVAGIWLVVTSVRSGGSDAVPEEVRRVAQVQTADMGPDEQARQLGLSAVLQVRKDGLELIPVTGDFGRAPLRVTLAHPSRAADDRTIELQRSESGWHADAELATSHDWSVQLAPQDGQWRLRGRLLRDTAAVRLAPAHEAN